MADYPLRPQQNLGFFLLPDGCHSRTKAAHVLAARLTGKVDVEVKIPDTPGTDWLDVLNARTTR